MYEALLFSEREDEDELVRGQWKAGCDERLKDQQTCGPGQVFSTEARR